MKEVAGDCAAKTDAIAEMVAHVTRRQVCASALMDGWAQNASCLVRTAIMGPDAPGPADVSMEANVTATADAHVWKAMLETSVNLRVKTVTGACSVKINANARMARRTLATTKTENASVFQDGVEIIARLRVYQAISGKDVLKNVHAKATNLAII